LNPIARTPRDGKLKQTRARAKKPDVIEWINERPDSWKAKRLPYQTAHDEFQKDRNRMFKRDRDPNDPSRPNFQDIYQEIFPDTKKRGVCVIRSIATTDSV
jgi:hypothetical protein